MGKKQTNNTTSRIWKGINLRKRERESPQEAYTAWGKCQSQFYGSFLSMEMKDATPLTTQPLSA